MQFSNDIQIEVPITTYDADSFAAVIKDMASPQNCYQQQSTTLYGQTTTQL